MLFPHDDYIVAASFLKDAHDKRGLIQKDTAAACGWDRGLLSDFLGQKLGEDSRHRAGMLGRAPIITLGAYCGASMRMVNGILLLLHTAGLLRPDPDPAGSVSEYLERRRNAFVPLHAAEWISHARGDRGDVSANDVTDLTSHDAATAAEALRAAYGIQEQRGWPNWPKRMDAIKRETLYAELARLLTSNDFLAEEPRSLGVLVWGPGGNGKSQLVTAVTSTPEVRDSYEGGRWVWARTQYVESPKAGRMPQVHAQEVLRDLAGQLSCSLPQLRRRLRDERLLVVIDNIEAVDREPELIRALLDSTGRSRFVFTSRICTRTDGLDVFHGGSGLPGLKLSETSALLRTLGQDQLDRGDERGVQLTRATDETFRRIQELTGGAPHWLRLIAGWLAREDLRDILAALKGGRHGGYEWMYGREWDRMAPDRRNVLAFLSRDVVGSVSWAVVADSHRDGERHLSALRDMSLVEDAASTREARDGSPRREDRLVTVLPLVAAFVGRQMDAEPPRHDVDETRSVARAGVSYLVSALQGMASGGRPRRPLGDARNYLKWIRELLKDDPALTAVATVRLARYLWEGGGKAGLTLFAACEHLLARALSELAPRYPHATRLMRGLVDSEMGYWHMDRREYAKAEALLRAAIRTFDDIHDPAGRSIARRYLAILHTRRAPRGEARLAVRLLDEAQRIAEAADRASRTKIEGQLPIEMAHAKRELRALGFWRDLKTSAQAYADKWTPSLAELLNVRGDALMAIGRWAAAKDCFDRSIDLYLSRAARGRWRGNEAAPLMMRADCLLKMSRPDELERRKYAEEDLRTALKVSRRAQRRDHEAGARLRLARLWRRTAPRAALEQAQTARAIFADEGQTRSEKEARRLAATIDRELQRRAERDAPRQGNVYL